MALWRVRATVVDKPGFLAVLTASLALRSVNILSVSVHVTEAGAVDDFLVDAPDGLTGQELIAAVERGRGREVWVAPAHAHRLVDAPTRALDLATLVVRDPDALAVALAELLDAEVTWHPGPVPELPPGLPMTAGDQPTGWSPPPAGSVPLGFGLAGTQMQVPGQGGGVWRLRRSAPEFTPAEYARAQALLAVAAASAERGDEAGEDPSAAAGERVEAAARSGGDLASRATPIGNRQLRPATLLLPDGRQVSIRAATPDDLDALVQMHRRCSPTTRYRRYLAGTQGPSEAMLARLLTPAHGHTLVVETGGGDLPAGAPRQLVAMANLVGEGVQAELALLVEDAWQRSGIGTALLRQSIAAAAAAGLDAVVVHSHAQNLAMQRTLRRLDVVQRAETDAGVLTVTLQLPSTPRDREQPCGQVTGSPSGPAA